MKKIIILGPAHPYRGGLASHNERLAQEYIKQGNEVKIYTFTLQYPSFLFPGKTQFSDDPAPKELKIYRKINAINPLNWLKIGKEISKEQPDLVIIRFWLPFMAPCLGTIARQIRKNRKTRIISILDNVIPHEKRIGDMPMIRYFVNSVDGFVAMSKSVLNDVNRFNTTKPKAFSPHPIYDNYGDIQTKDLSCNSLEIDNTPIYLLFFGFIRSYKGLDLLLEAFADSRLRQFPVKLIIAGEFYEDKKPYLDAIKKFNLANDVILRTNFISNEQVKDYFCAADLIVQPYKSATQSGVTQIAYHFEKPMLVTNVGGLAEIIPHGKVGYVVEPLKEEITSAILDFLTRKPDFSVGIKEEKQKYTWDKLISAVDSIEEQLL
ncbi:MAG: glycosyltransferase [Oscillospiraceae bacterium]|jgi:glycosyltransferase involved in cell wall biosynthesis|nr:glycosyltransferase [Oscillospiraceae bacterium]